MNMKIKIIGPKGKENEKTKKTIEDIMRKFLEGEIPTKDFWTMYLNNNDLQRTIEDDPCLPKTARTKYRSAFLYDINIDILEHRIEVIRVINNYFNRRRIDIVVSNPDYLLYKLILKVTPTYATINDTSIILNLLDRKPKDMTQEETIDWLKKQVIDMFPFEKKPPQWLQEPEWPIFDSKPLLFSHQDISVNEYMNNPSIEKIHYYFKHPKIENYVVVEQYT